MKQVLLKAKNASRVLPSKEKAPSTAKKIPSVLLQNLSIRKKPEGSVPKITQVSPDRFEVGLNAFQKANYAKARLVWTKLAKDGDPDAQYNLANMYRTGRGGASDLKLALKYYTLAARKGLRLAQFNLGNIYMHGRGVAQNYEKALEWYQRAAATGYTPALINIGFMYESGYGVKKDQKVALAWYQRAGNHGSALAKLMAKEIEPTVLTHNRVSDKKNKKIAQATSAYSNKTKLYTAANSNFEWGQNVFSWPPKGVTLPQQAASTVVPQKRQARALDQAVTSSQQMSP